MSGETHILTHEFAPFRGGIGVYVEETARGMAAAGGHPVVWAPDYGSPGEDRFPFQVRRLAMRGKQDWLCRLRLARALREAFPSNHLPGTLVLAEPGPLRLWMYRKVLPLPEPDRLAVILYGSEIRRLSRPLHRRLFRSLLLEADIVGVISAPVRQMLLDVCPEVKTKCVMVPGAVRSCWADKPPVFDQRRSHPREIIQVGRLHPRKGQIQLLEALENLPVKLLRDLRVRIIGPPGRRSYMLALEQRIRARGLPVRLEGSLPDEQLQEAYSRASLLVMPSQAFRDSFEGQGMTLLEAQHFGCPVIGTNFGGIPETFLDGETGLLVPPGNPRALAAALQRLLDHPAEAARMGQAGAAFVRDTFSWQDNVRKLGLV